MSASPTVRIKSSEPGHQPDGFVVIDASAFDRDKHELFDEQPAASDKQPKAAAKPAAKKE